MNFGHLDLSKLNDPTINVLLLGEVGIGKSTFVNSIANYLCYDNFYNAIENTPIVLAPTTVSLLNKDNDTIYIPIQPSSELKSLGKKNTSSNVSEYFLVDPQDSKIIRFIDTPGIGNLEGVETDDKIIEDILLHLLNLSSLHAICFFMKPTTARSNALFEYCMKQFLSKLEKTATQNLIFIFTNTRSAFYTPGDTLSCLRELFKTLKENPPFVNIPFNKNNMFCLDNEGFKYLAVISKKITVKKTILEGAADSWKVSAAECKRLISYIKKLSPHRISKTIDINKSKSLTFEHFQVLFEVSQMIFDNIAIMRKFEYELKMENNDLEELKKKLSKPKKSVEMVWLPHKMVFCTSKKCTIDVMCDGDKNEKIYQQICHENPEKVSKRWFFEFSNKSNVIARAIGWSSCKVCSCKMQAHKLFEWTRAIKIEHDTSKISNKEQILNKKHETLRTLQQDISELSSECDQIIVSLAKFTLFLQTNSICPVADSFIQNIKDLIGENTTKDGNWDRAVNLKKLQEKYESAKKKLENELIDEISVTDIETNLEKLYHLKHSGKTIQELCEKQIARSDGGTIKRKQTVNVSRKCDVITKQMNVAVKNLPCTSKQTYTSQTTIDIKSKHPAGVISGGNLSASKTSNEISTEKQLFGVCKKTKDFGQYVNMDLEFRTPLFPHYAPQFPPYFGATLQQPPHIANMPPYYANNPFNQTIPNAIFGSPYAPFPPNYFPPRGLIAPENIHDPRQFMPYQGYNQPNAETQKSDTEKSLEGSWQ